MALADNPKMDVGLAADLAVALELQVQVFSEFVALATQTLASVQAAVVLDMQR